MPCFVITLVSSRSVSSTPSISAAEAARLSSGIAWIARFRLS
jgi:hypothetical protein